MRDEKEISRGPELLHPLLIMLEVTGANAGFYVLSSCQEIFFSHLLFQQLSLRQLSYLSNPSNLHQLPTHWHIGSVSTNIANICSTVSLRSLHQLLPLHLLRNLQLLQIDLEHLPSSLLLRQRNVYIIRKTHILFSSLLRKA